MSIRFDDFSFYHVDTAYLQYLNCIDSEVAFTQEKDYTKKPFLGILVIIDTYTYFIPLTSGKQKHTKWKNVGPAHYLIYEQVKKEELRKRDIFKSISDTEALKILSALDLKKMIPVPDGLYTRINFSSLSDKKYVDLLEKEYRFCKRQRNGILSKVNQIYRKQKKTGQVYPMYCDFSKLETACEQYDPYK